MRELQEIRKLIEGNNKEEALALLQKMEQAFLSQSNTINALKAENEIIQKKLENAEDNLESIEKETDSKNEHQEKSKDELIRVAQYHLDKIINEISSGLAFIDFNLQYVLANHSYLKWVGKDDSEVKGIPIIRIIGKNRFIELREVIQRALKGERTDIETSFLDSNDKRVYISASYIPSFNMKRQVNGVYIFEQDITILKQNEFTLEEKNTELQTYIESNLQLENFAHIASHDLKAPLNSIGNYAELLLKSSTQKLSVTDLKFLNFIRQGSENMKSTIASLLNFSLATNQKAVFQYADLNEIVRELLKDIEASLEDKGAKVEVEKLPDNVLCDKQLLRQLFQNLILNAIKFSKEDVVPVVKIKASEMNQFWRIEVKDNGIGISQAYFEKIFVLFQRLHTQKKFEGTGIGLATCKKIVELHHGTIGVESEEEVGSNFIFTIKKQ